MSYVQGSQRINQHWLQSALIGQACLVLNGQIHYNRESSAVRLTEERGVRFLPGVLTPMHSC